MYTNANKPNCGVKTMYAIFLMSEKVAIKLITRLNNNNHAITCTIGSTFLFPFISKGKYCCALINKSIAKYYKSIDQKLKALTKGIV